MDYEENYQEGKVYTHRIILASGSYDIILIKNDGNFFALSAVDPYDGATHLSKATVYGNKLLSPSNGCAYCIETGNVEYGPAFDNLPIFKTQVVDGQVKVIVPKKPPVKVRPYLAMRDYADMRKVVIVGSSEAALACAETLRHMEYTVLAG